MNQKFACSKNAYQKKFKWIFNNIDKNKTIKFKN